jgi:hypothetical protein
MWHGTSAVILRADEARRVTTGENGARLTARAGRELRYPRPGTGVEVVLCLSVLTAILRLTRADSLVSPSVASIQDEHA